MASSQYYYYYYYYNVFSLTAPRMKSNYSFSFSSNKTILKRPKSLLSSIEDNNNKHLLNYNTTFVSGGAEVVLGTPARFEASKLKVINVTGEEEDMVLNKSCIPRAYILSHCDFTANLTLNISNVIKLDQLKGWYSKDDVVAEWKRVNGEMCLHIHCFVSGPNLLLQIAAQLRYHIFSRELPLVLEAVLHGDSKLFKNYPQLFDSMVRVYFHSSFPKFNRVECWGPLKDAIIQRNNNIPAPPQGFCFSKTPNPISILQAIFSFLL